MLLLAHWINQTNYYEARYKSYTLKIFGYIK